MLLPCKLWRVTQVRAPPLAACLCHLQNMWIGWSRIVWRRHLTEGQKSKENLYIEICYEVAPYLGNVDIHCGCLLKK